LFERHPYTRIGLEPYRQIFNIAVEVKINPEAMYGSHTADPVVKYYDITLGISGKNEATWYLDNIRASGDRFWTLAAEQEDYPFLLRGKVFM
jgi:hypothetical protein